MRRSSRLVICRSISIRWLALRACAAFVERAGSAAATACRRRRRTRRRPPPACRRRRAAGTASGSRSAKSISCRTSPGPSSVSRARSRLPGDAAGGQRHQLRGAVATASSRTWPLRAVDAHRLGRLAVDRAADAFVDRHRQHAGVAVVDVLRDHHAGDVRRHGLQQQHGRVDMLRPLHVRLAPGPGARRVGRGPDLADALDDVVEADDVEQRQVQPGAGEAGQVLDVGVGADEHAAVEAGAELARHRRAQAARGTAARDRCCGRSRRSRRAAPRRRPAPRPSPAGIASSLRKLSTIHWYTVFGCRPCTACRAPPRGTGRTGCPRPAPRGRGSATSARRAWPPSGRRCGRSRRRAACPG